MKENSNKLTNEKPKFEQLTTMTLPDVGLRFNARRIGPKNFKGLRENDYGEGFRMPTIPELVPLIYASLGNKNYNTTKNVVKTLKKDWITGDTGILYVPEGMFVQDNPELKDGQISMNQTALEKRLGSHKERGVIFSDNRSVRFTSYDFKRKSQTPLELSINTGIIALVGGEENAEKLAKASEHYRLKPYFYTLKNVGSSITRIADLDSSYLFTGKLTVDADHIEDFANQCSLGVQKIKQKAENKI